MTSTSRSIDNLKAAIDRSSSDCIKSQLRTGSDPNAIVDVGDVKMYMLAYAIRQRAGFYVYQALLDGGAAVSPTGDPKALTPLYSAALEGDLRICRELVERGADVDQKTAIGATPLQAASLAGRCEVGQYLVKNGADVHHENNRGMTALDMAVTSSFPKASLQLVRLFVSLGASPSRPQSSGQNENATAFHRAIELGAVDFVTYFIHECGEDPNQVTADGRTMLELASADTMKEVLNRAIRMACVEQSIDDSIESCALVEPAVLRSSHGPGPL